MALLALANPVVWLVSARHADQRAGMIASWVTPATLSADQPRALAVLSIETRTQQLIEMSGRFALQLLSHDQRDVVARFGLPLAQGEDKWDGWAAGHTPGGLPLVEGGCGFAECAVSAQLHTGDRIVYVGDIVAERVYEGRVPLRESDALNQQPGAIAAALRDSYDRDVSRDGNLLRRRGIDGDS